MSDPKANQEPSMEEILASIRRIISEDDEPESANKAAAPQPAAEPPPQVKKEKPEDVKAEVVDTAPPDPDPDQVSDDEPLDLTQLAPMDDDVLELTQMADDTETAEPPTGLEAGSADDGFDMADTDKTPDVAADDDDEFNLGADKESGSAADDSLVSAEAVGAAGAAIARLQQTAEERAAANRPTAVALGNGSLTLEDIVREELRPLLRDWLEQNLPPLVERIVEREVEKIGRNALR
ncbi:MAG: DUF2497 domain-containing protein [Inquilinaceae bacterium]